MGRTIGKAASVGEQRVTSMPRGCLSPAAGESNTAKYNIEVTGQAWGRLTVDGPVGQLNHLVHLLRQTEEPAPPPGVLACNDCALDHEAA